MCICNREYQLIQGRAQPCAFVEEWFTTASRVEGKLHILCSMALHLMLTWCCTDVESSRPCMGMWPMQSRAHVQIQMPLVILLYKLSFEATSVTGFTWLPTAYVYMYMEQPS